jgi:hypothetical protein
MFPFLLKLVLMAYHSLWESCHFIHMIPQVDRGLRSMTSSYKWPILKVSANRTHHIHLQDFPLFWGLKSCFRLPTISGYYLPFKDGNMWHIQSVCSLGLRKPEVRNDATVMQHVKEDVHWSFQGICRRSAPYLGEVSFRVDPGGLKCHKQSSWWTLMNIT